MAQYSAPGRDGSYIDDPGRDHPTYNEQESLLIVRELDSMEDGDDPYRPREEFEDDYDPRAGTSLVAADDRQYRDQRYRDRPPPEHSTVAIQKAPPPDDDDSDDDLMFEEDRQAMAETRMVTREEDPRDEAFTQDQFFESEGYPDQNEENYGGRQWKYSTANMKQRGGCWKWCCIILFFILCMLLFALISWLFESIFFKDPGPAPPPTFSERPDNDTFPQNKEFVDAVCVQGTERDMRCREFCEPVHMACCKPFPHFEIYNYTAVHEALNSTPPPTQAIDDDNFMHLNDCEFGDHLRGCNSYSKCASLSGVIDPAVEDLDEWCSLEQLEKDRTTCEAACRKVECCYNEDGLNCMTENMDVCMDYAPCQNLREQEDRNSEFVPAAPADLDKWCLWKTPQCLDECDKASCCSDTNSRCFQENFISCLTYAGCEDHPETPIKNITVPPIYSYVDMAPAEIIYACGEKDPETEGIFNLVHMDNCPEYCEQVACCYQSTAADNCFHRDPLGCWAWHQHCQAEEVMVKNWYGEIVLPTPP